MLARTHQRTQKINTVSPVDMPAPVLGALAPSYSYEELYAAGFRSVVIGAAWSAIEPEKDIFSATALTELQLKINTARAVGLEVSLDVGVQYAPEWVFNLGADTRFVNQFGDRFGGAPASGNNVPNGVTSQVVRSRIEAYLDCLAGTVQNISSVRIGGGAYNELRYPSGWEGTQPNSWWFYDPSSQAMLSPMTQGWVAGSGTVQQATEFINTYCNALTGYGIWLAERGITLFANTVDIHLLLPGWGIRGDAKALAANSLLAQQPEELMEGLDWQVMIPQIPSHSRIVAYSTYADATNAPHLSTISTRL